MKTNGKMTGMTPKGCTAWAWALAFLAVACGGLKAATIQLATTNAYSGITFALPLTVECGAAALGRYDATINYNPSILQVAGFSGGTGEFDSPQFSTNSAGRIILSDENWSSLHSPTGSFLVAQIAFKALGTPGSSSPLTFESAALYDTDGNSLSVTTSNGAVVLETPVRIRVGSTNVIGGTSFSVPLMVESWVNALGRYEAEVSFNTNVVKLQSVTGGSSPFNSLMANTNIPGKVVLIGENMVSLDSPTGLVTVAQLNFLAVGGVGTSSALALANTSVLNTDAATMTSSNMNGMVNVDLDSDADHIPDWWLQQYFGHPTSQGNDHSRAGDDASGTGQNNLFKYVAGLDPTNAASRFLMRVEPVPGQPGHMNFIFSPRWNDRTYTPLFCTNLLGSPSWSALTSTNVSDNGTERTVTDPDATGDSKFYRIQITWP